MNHNFKLKYDQMRQNTSESASNEDSDINRYDRPSHDRKVCFILSDGNRLRLNYALLISEECFPDENKIILTFTSHTITLKGQHLDMLFDEFEQNMVRIVVSADSRYNAVDENNPTINEILITTMSE